MGLAERFFFRIRVSPWYWRLCYAFGERFLLTAVPVLLLAGMLGGCLLLWLRNAVALAVFLPLLGLFAWQTWRAEGLREYAYQLEEAALDEREKPFNG